MSFLLKGWAVLYMGSWKAEESMGLATHSRL